MSVQPLRLAFATESTASSIARALEEPDWLLDERLDAARLVAELPAETNQLFTPYIDLRIPRFAEIAPYERVHRVDRAVALPPGAAALVAVHGDRVSIAVSEEAREAGLIVETFDDALRARPELLRAAIEGGRSLPANDAFAQVARAVSTVGILIHVPSGLELAQPIVVRWGESVAGRGLVGRTLISLGDAARASVLEEQLPAASTDGEAQSLWWGTMEVSLGAGAGLDVAGEQDFGPRTVAFVTRHAELDRDATLRWALASVGAALYRSRIDNRLVGRGSSVQQVEIGFGGGSQLFDLTSYTRHVGEDTTGDLLSKGVFLDRARGYFKGLIAIEKSARGTDSFLGEFAMLLTKRARSVAIPSLEIDQPDVRRASHSSSVGPIDEAQIFYLMTRGLSREDARKAIVLGFLEPVVARIPLPDARERLRHLLEAKWPETPAQPAAA